MIAKPASKSESMNRGNLIHASDTWQDLKRSNPDTKFGRQDYYDHLRDAHRSYRHLDPAIRDELAMRARTPGFGRGPDAHLQSEHDMPASRGYNLDGQTLMGLSNETSPLDPTLADELLRELMGVSDVGGFSSYEDKIRKLFQDRIVHT